MIIFGEKIGRSKFPSLKLKKMETEKKNSQNCLKNFRFFEQISACRLFEYVVLWNIEIISSFVHKYSQLFHPFFLQITFPTFPVDSPLIKWKLSLLPSYPYLSLSIPSFVHTSRISWEKCL